MTALSASVYAADPFRLAEDIEAVLPNVESLHLDVMDGVFAPEYGLTARVIRNLSECASKPLDVHLMVARPRDAVIRFSELGVRSLAIHLEAEEDFVELSRIARANGSGAFAALRHTTPISELEKVAEHTDGCLLLTAPAGGGSSTTGPSSASPSARPGFTPSSTGRSFPNTSRGWTNWASIWRWLAQRCSRMATRGNAPELSRACSGSLPLNPRRADGRQFLDLKDAPKSVPLMAYQFAAMTLSTFSEVTASHGT